MLANPKKVAQAITALISKDIAVSALHHESPSSLSREGERTFHSVRHVAPRGTKSLSAAKAKAASDCRGTISPARIHAAKVPSPGNRERFLYLCGGLIKSQGSTFSATAKRPSTLTLAETRARSIEPT